MKIKVNDSQKKYEELQEKIKELNINNKALRNLNEISEKLNSSIIKTTRRSERRSIFDTNVINKVERRESFLQTNKDSIDIEEFNSNNENQFIRSKSVINNNQRIRSLSASATQFGLNKSNRMSKDHLYKSIYNPHFC